VNVRIACKIVQVGYGQVVCAMDDDLQCVRRRHGKSGQAIVKFGYKKGLWLVVALNTSGILVGELVGREEAGGQRTKFIVAASVQASERNRRKPRPKIASVGTYIHDVIDHDKHSYRTTHNL
jgi:hypothetical protein